jgi:hypothetical protein
VVNVIGGKPVSVEKPKSENGQPTPQLTPEEIAIEQQRRFEEMRSRLLGHASRED